MIRQLPKDSGSYQDEIHEMEDVIFCDRCEDETDVYDEVFPGKHICSSCMKGSRLYHMLFYKQLGSLFKDFKEIYSVKNLHVPIMGSMQKFDR